LDVIENHLPGCEFDRDAFVALVRGLCPAPVA